MDRIELGRERRSAEVTPGVVRRSGRKEKRLIAKIVWERGEW